MKIHRGMKTGSKFEDLMSVSASLRKSLWIQINRDDVVKGQNNSNMLFQLRSKKESKKVKRINWKKGVNKQVWLCHLLDVSVTEKRVLRSPVSLQFTKFIGFRTAVSTVVPVKMEKFCDFTASRPLEIPSEACEFEFSSDFSMRKIQHSCN